MVFRARSVKLAIVILLLTISNASAASGAQSSETIVANQAGTATAVNESQSQVVFRLAQDFWKLDSAGRTDFKSAVARLDTSRELSTQDKTEPAIPQPSAAVVPDPAGLKASINSTAVSTGALVPPVSLGLASANSSLAPAQAPNPVNSSVAPILAFGLANSSSAPTPVPDSVNSSVASIRTSSPTDSTDSQSSSAIATQASRPQVSSQQSGSSGESSELSGLSIGFIVVASIAVVGLVVGFAVRKYRRAGCSRSMAE